MRTKKKIGSLKNKVSLFKARKRRKDLAKLPPPSLSMSLSTSMMSRNTLREMPLKSQLVSSPFSREARTKIF